MAKELKKKRDEAKQAWENATVVMKKAKNVDDFTGSKKAHDEAAKLRVEYLMAEKASDTDSDDENTLAMSAHRWQGVETFVFSGIRRLSRSGSVTACEIEHELAQDATRNLADFSNVVVHHRSGSEGLLPDCDAIYINAGATAPLDIWLDALRPNGRLLFPLTPTDGPGGMPGAGGMILVTRASNDGFDARFVCPVMIIPCVGARDEETASRLSEAFKRGDSRNVRSLRRNTPPDETCWCSGNGWWLFTSQIHDWFGSSGSAR
jgi:hypothetical protein